MERKLENPKEDIYGVAWQHNFKVQMSNLTVPSDSCDCGSACLGLKASSTLTTWLTPGSQTWLHAGTMWGDLKNTDAGNPPPETVI